MIALTYALFALSLAFLLDKNKIIVVIFSLVPGFGFLLEFLYPFQYHGIMHSVLAAVAFSILTYTYTENRIDAESCFLGYSSALFLELTSYSKIPLLFPLDREFSFSIWNSYSLEANLAVISLSLIIIVSSENWSRLNKRISPVRSEKSGKTLT